MTTQALRSRNWFGRQDLDGFVHRSWLKSEGFSDVVFDGRPVIGIANSWSELTNCNAHLRQVAEAVFLAEEDVNKNQGRAAANQQVQPVLQGLGRDVFPVLGFQHLADNGRLCLAVLDNERQAVSHMIPAICRL